MKIGPFEAVAALVVWWFWGAKDAEEENGAGEPATQQDPTWTGTDPQRLQGDPVKEWSPFDTPTVKEWSPFDTPKLGADEWEAGIGQEPRGGEQRPGSQAIRPGFVLDPPEDKPWSTVLGRGRRRVDPSRRF